jgi:hypothetical protein
MPHVLPPGLLAGAAFVALAATMTAQSTTPPRAEITNGLLKVLVYLPDATHGFFRGTRFDWAGVVGRLEYQNHVFYAPWFSRLDPALRDYTSTDSEVVAGPNTAITGPVEEFQQPLGYDEAAPGGSFVKVGVGRLRKPEAGGAYSAFRLYDIVDPGVRTLDTKSDAITFTHELRDPAGYGYHYTKTLRLTAGQPELTIEHRLRNTGTQRIATTVYNHNFLTLDGRPTGTGFVVKTPYTIVSARPPDPALAMIDGREVRYVANLTGRQTVSTPLSGFGTTAADYDFRVEHTGAGAGVRIVGDRPMSSVTLWSMRTTIGLEPFIAIGIAPGGEFTWTIAYTYYKM